MGLRGNAKNDIHLGLLNIQRFRAKHLPSMGAGWGSFALWPSQCISALLSVFDPAVWPSFLLWTMGPVKRWTPSAANTLPMSHVGSTFLLICEIEHERVHTYSPYLRNRCELTRQFAWNKTDIVVFLMPSGMDSCLTIHVITRCPERAPDVPYRPRNSGVLDETTELH